jgi:hypothetical protein
LGAAAHFPKVPQDPPRYRRLFIVDFPRQHTVAYLPSESPARFAGEKWHLSASFEFSSQKGCLSHSLSFYVTPKVSSDNWRGQKGERWRVTPSVEQEKQNKCHPAWRLVLAPKLLTHANPVTRLRRHHLLLFASDRLIYPT